MVRTAEYMRLTVRITSSSVAGLTIAPGTFKSMLDHRSKDFLKSSSCRSVKILVSLETLLCKS